MRPKVYFRSSFFTVRDMDENDGNGMVTVSFSWPRTLQQKSEFDVELLSFLRRHFPDAEVELEK